MKNNTYVLRKKILSTDTLPTTVSDSQHPFLPFVKLADSSNGAAGSQPTNNCEESRREALNGGVASRTAARLSALEEPGRQLRVVRDGRPGGWIRSCTAAFGAIVRPNVPSVYLVTGENKMLIRDDNMNLVAVKGAGNEIQEPVPGLLTALAEDLNADGTVDLYATSSLSGISSFYLCGQPWLCVVHDRGEVQLAGAVRRPLACSGDI